MQLDFLSACAHRDISTGAFTSANSLLGHASSLLHCAFTELERLWLLLHKHIRCASLVPCTAEWELALKLGVTASAIGKLSKECAAAVQESWQSLPLPFMYSSKRNLLLKGPSAVILSQRNIMEL